MFDMNKRRHIEIIKRNQLSEGMEEYGIERREVRIKGRDGWSGKEVTYSLTHTEHSRLRSSQRGIDPFRLEAAIRFGEVVMKQGLMYCILGDSLIPDHLSRDRDKLRNTVVVLSGDSDEIITCYRGKNPFRRIKRKRKDLWVGRMAA